MAANKYEQFKVHSAVPLDEAMNYAHENGLIFMETSAKTGSNVQDLFLTIGMYEMMKFTFNPWTTGTVHKTSTASNLRVFFFIMQVKH